jgi:capsular polysaccharide biosynthesis protein
MSDEISREVAPWVLPPSWMVGARSMMIDRAVPRLEYIWLPAVTQLGGSIRIVRHRSGTAPERKSGWRVTAHRMMRKDAGVGPVAGPIVDLRLNFPENWAHAQIFHLPLAQMVREWIGATPTVLLTFATPGYVKALFRHFGFPVVATERAVRGDVVIPYVASGDILRPVRRSLAAGLIADLDARRAAGDLPVGLPEKIFVVRAKTRRIENEAEVEAYLAADGFVKVYPERMSVPEQVELFNAAREVVAIHGAALAPLLFRSPSAPPVRLVEILSPGHVANSYRLMIDQVGGEYVAVRGRIKPGYVEPAYKLGSLFRQFSLDDFTVDLESLKAARAILETGAPPERIA